MLRQVVLLVAFLVLVIAGVVTVLVPELEDDPVDNPRGTDTAEPAE